jgi:hypothetical protein
MTIHHVNSNCSYTLYQSKGNFFIESGAYKAIHAKSDIHAAIWYLIDWIRMVCFTNLTDEDCIKIGVLGKSTDRLDKESVMNTICGRKLNRVFYEHSYALIYEAYDNDSQQIISLDNERNFFLYEEILQLLRFSPVSEKKIP